MVDSVVAPGVVSDGHGLVLWVPEIADPNSPTLAELTAPEVVDLTYMLFPDGFDHQIDITKFESSRYTLAQVLEREGKRKDTIVLKYPIEGKPTDIVRTTLTPGVRGYIVERLGTPNAEDLAEGQYLSLVAPVQAGTQKKMPITANTEIGKEQELLVTGNVVTDVYVDASGQTGWTIDIEGTPTGGDYTLFVNNVETQPLAYNASNTAIQSAINGLQSVTGVTATVASGAPFAVTFSDDVMLAAGANGLTGGDDPIVVVAAV